MYATSTTVSVERSRAEIETILKRYGADQFVSGWDADRALIGFRCKGRSIRFVLTMPGRRDRHITHTEHRGQLRSASEQDKAWEQACRSRWRALCLCIKAKLEAVEAGIESFDDAFLPHIVLPGGETVSNWLAPQIAAAYETGNVPKLLPFVREA